MNLESLRKFMGKVSVIAAFQLWLWMEVALGLAVRAESLKQTVLAIGAFLSLATGTVACVWHVIDGVIRSREGGDDDDDDDDDDHGGKVCPTGPAPRFEMEVRE